MPTTGQYPSHDSNTLSHIENYTRLSGRYPWAIEITHLKYGPIVRITPNELVFMTPQAFTGIAPPPPSITYISLTTAYISTPRIIRTWRPSSKQISTTGPQPRRFNLGRRTPQTPRRSEVYPPRIFQPLTLTHATFSA